MKFEVCVWSVWELEIGSLFCLACVFARVHVYMCVCERENSSMCLYFYTHVLPSPVFEYETLRLDARPGSS